MGEDENNFLDAEGDEWDVISGIGSRKDLSEVEMKLVADLHEIFRGDLTMASDVTDIPASTFIDIWKRDGKRFYFDAIEYDEQISLIKGAHGLYGGNADKAGADLGFKPRYIFDVWKKAGLEAVDRGTPKGKPRYFWSKK